MSAKTKTTAKAVKAVKPSVKITTEPAETTADAPPAAIEPADTIDPEPAEVPAAAPDVPEVEAPAKAPREKSKKPASVEELVLARLTKLLDGHRAAALLPDVMRAIAAGQAVTVTKAGGANLVEIHKSVRYQNKKALARVSAAAGEALVEILNQTVEASFGGD